MAAGNTRPALQTNERGFTVTSPANYFTPASTDAGKDDRPVGAGLAADVDRDLEEADEGLDVVHAERAADKHRGQLGVPEDEGAGVVAVKLRDGVSQRRVGEMQAGRLPLQSSADLLGGHGGHPGRRRGRSQRHEHLLAGSDEQLRGGFGDGAVVGNIGSFYAHGGREVGYWIGREHWGKGYATEAGRAVLAVALAAGFGSVRRFNETFRRLFDRPPSALRRRSGGDTSARDGVTLMLAYRPPYDWPGMLAALEARVDATIAQLTAPEDYRDLKQLQQSAKMSAAMHAAAKAQLAPVLARAETGSGAATGALRK